MRRLPALAFLLILASCGKQVNIANDATPKDPPKLTTAMTPRCVGRFLIDLPDDFIINPVSNTVVEGISLTVEPASRTLFDQQFMARNALLANQKVVGKGPSRPYLRSMTALLDSSPGGIFDRVEDPTQSSRLPRTLEMWAWKDGFKILATVNATDTTFPEDADDTLAQQLHTDVGEKRATLIQVVTRTRGRADTEVPKEPGVCFRYGFTAGKATDAEWIDVNYHLAKAEDVYFAFHSLSDIGPQSTTLSQRGASIEQSLRHVDGKTLRHGSRQGKDLRFEEWLVTRESDPGVKDFHFSLELNSKSGDALAPLLAAEYSSGVRHPTPPQSPDEIASQPRITVATYDEQKSLAIWDATTATLRKRPGAF